MNKLSVLCLLFSMLSAPCALLAADYPLPEPISVGVEGYSYTRSIVAVSYYIEQLSILRLPDGDISCRAVLMLSDGSNSYRRVVTANQTQIVAAIGVTNLTALIGGMGQAAGAILIKELEGQYGGGE